MNVNEIVNEVERFPKLDCAVKFLTAYYEMSKVEAVRLLATYSYGDVTFDVALSRVIENMANKKAKPVWTMEEIDVLNRAHLSVPDQCPETNPTIQESKDESIDDIFSVEAIAEHIRVKKRLEEENQRIVGYGTFEEPIGLRSRRRIW